MRESLAITLRLIILFRSGAKLRPTTPLDVVLFAVAARSRVFAIFYHQRGRRDITPAAAACHLQLSEIWFKLVELSIRLQTMHFTSSAR